MKHTKKYTIALGIVGAVLVLGMFSKPDRGGVDRCAKIFDIPEVKELGLSHRSFKTWNLFESPKFCFTISPHDFEQLSKELKSRGYSEWTTGGITFGSIDVGWNSSDDHIYCKLPKGSHNHYWSYSANENLIYAITFPS